MRISTRGRYALRLMLDLAQAAPQEHRSLKEVAERRNISEKYSEQIIARLVKAGLVESVRGAQGGYRLTRSPQEYTAGEILRRAEGSLAPVACVEEPQFCEQAEKCAAHWLWGKLDGAINDALDGVTLEQLVIIEREKNEGSVR